MPNTKATGVAFSDPQFESLTLTGGISQGTSAAPLTVASGNQNALYGTATNTSGDVRLIYSKLNFTGAGGSGETLRAFTTVAAAVATGGTVNGAHISLSVNSGGSISGAANALRVTLGAAASVTTGGTVAALQLDSDLGSGATLPSTAAFMRVTDSGTVKIGSLLNMPAPASNTIFRAKSAAAVTHVIKIVADNGTPYYLMVSDQV